MSKHRGNGLAAARRLQQGRASKFCHADAGAASQAAASLMEDCGLSRPMVEVLRTRIGHKAYQESIATHGLLPQSTVSPCPRCLKHGRKGEEIHLYIVAQGYDGAGDVVAFCMSCAKREFKNIPWTLQAPEFFGIAVEFGDM